jgi:acetyl esterase/lipase
MAGNRPGAAPLMPLKGFLAATLAALCAIAASGCQRTVLAFANRGVQQPDASVVYAAEHGLRLDVYRPRAGDESAPVVVFFYGGSWESGRRADYRFVGRRLADAGVLTLVADYRTWPTAGFPGFMHDAARAVAWAHTHAKAHGGDPARLFVAGHSAGAQIAALLGSDTRYLSAQGLQARRLAGVIGLSGPYDFDITGNLVPIFGPPAQWPDAQALNFVDGDEPPFLLVHGTGDMRVEARDSVLMAERLQARGGRVELLMLEGASHTAPLAALYEPARDPRVLQAIKSFVGVD